MHKRLLCTLQRAFKNGPVSQHRSLINLYNYKPNINAEAFVHPSATICGEVILAPQAQVWHNTVVRGDMNAIVIDQDSIIMENCSLSTIPSILNSGEVADLIVSQKVVIMPNCTLVSCKVEEDCYIGAGTVICEGAKVDTGSFIGPGSVIPPNRYIPPGQLWAGNPVRYVKSLEKPDKVAFMDLRKTYLEKKILYITEFGEFNNAYLEAEALSPVHSEDAPAHTVILEEKLVEDK